MRPILICLLVSALAPAIASGEDRRWARNWKSLNAEERDQALQNFERYQSLSPDEKKGFHAGYQKWKNLSPERKSQLRRRHEDLHSLPDDQRQQLLDGLRGR